LGNNNITTFQANAFNGLPNLEALDVHKNNITTISDHSFIGLKNLASLRLGMNKIITLSNSLKKALPNCKIYIEKNVQYVNDVETQETVEYGNCIDEIRNKITNIDLQISKLQKAKEMLLEAVQILKK